MFSLIIRAYVIPLLNNKFLPADERISFKDKIVNKKDAFIQGIKKRYYKITKNFGKIQYAEQESIKDLIEEWKSKFAIYALIVIGIGMLIITPVSMIFIIFWVRVFILDQDNLHKFERYILMIGHIVTIIVTLLIPFVPQLIPQSYESIQEFSYLADMAYFFGLALVFWMY